MADNGEPEEPVPYEEEAVKASKIDREGDEAEDLKGKTERTTWGEVCRTCFIHTPKEWLNVFITIILVCFFLYFFIVGLELLGDGAQVLTGCAAGTLFSDDMNPIAGLMIGMLTTVLLQSSSTTTSIIVSLVGAGAIGVNAAIYMVMGANIGTSVTNTIVAMGQLGDGDQLERAFAGATVHDMFNFLSVIVLLPLEVVSGYLQKVTEKMVDGFETKEGEKREGFVKKIIEPLGLMLIKVNKDVTKTVAKGGSCSDFYPIECSDPANPTKATCEIGLIACNGPSGWGKSDCPALFDVNATQSDDELSGVVAFLVGLVILFICLAGLVTVLQKSLREVSANIVHKATNINGYLAMIIGCGITVAVQSSSITTSTLTPLVGLDILQIEQMYPLTLGANIGTTLTAIMSALVTDGSDALQVALCHLFFNLTGIVIWYPIPFMRAIPIHLARQLGKATRHWKGFPILYIAFAFFLVPLLFLGISALFEQKTPGGNAAGSIIVILLAALIGWFVYWLKCKKGDQWLAERLSTRQKRVDAKETLSYDMFWAKRKIGDLYEQTGCPAPDEAPSPSMTSKEALLDVHTDMAWVLDSIKKLITHSGLPEEPVLKPTEGVFGGSIRFANKETESEHMPDVDTSGWRNYHLTILTIYFIVLAFIFWGIGKLYVNSSVASTAMAGFLTIVVGVFLLWRAYEFFLHDGSGKSKAKYIDRKLRKQYLESYAQDIATVRADIAQLTEYTNMPTDDPDDAVEEDIEALDNGQSADLRVSHVSHVSA